MPPTQLRLAFVFAILTTLLYAAEAQVFICPEAGVFPDPVYCQVSHKCPDAGIVSYTTVCPPGTIFDVTDCKPPSESTRQCEGPDLPVEEKPKKSPTPKPGEPKEHHKMQKPSHHSQSDKGEPKEHHKMQKPPHHSQPDKGEPKEHHKAQKPQHQSQSDKAQSADVSEVKELPPVDAQAEIAPQVKKPEPLQTPSKQVSKPKHSSRSALPAQPAKSADVPKVMQQEPLNQIPSTRAPSTHEPIVKITKLGPSNKIPSTQARSTNVPEVKKHGPPYKVPLTRVTIRPHTKQGSPDHGTLPILPAQQKNEPVKKKTHPLKKKDYLLN